MDLVDDVGGGQVSAGVDPHLYRDTGVGKRRMSDREAVDRYAFDARWRYAAGVGGYDGDGLAHRRAAGAADQW
jgi:hypothetical protein